MLEEYNHYITLEADPLQVTKDATMRIERNNQSVTLAFYEKFVLKKLGFNEWIEVHTLASKNNTKANNILLRNLEAKGRRRGIPSGHYCSADQTSERHSEGLFKAEEMFVKFDLTIEARNDVTEARKTSLGIEGLTECKASASNLRRIQVKDIVKEVEDYLKTYSSAEMDINWYIEGIR
ncbi:hypothetical protein Tco_1515836 [Tanacetum coccineum]